MRFGIVGLGTDTAATPSTSATSSRRSSPRPSARISELVGGVLLAAGLLTPLAAALELLARIEQLESRRP